MAVMRRPGIPKPSPGMSAPKRGTSSVSIQIHLNASATSFFAKRIGTPGSPGTHQRIIRMTSRWRGWSVGGCAEVSVPSLKTR